MAHFARIKNGIVDFVTVGRDDDENREDELAHDGWIYRRTSYNTRGGVHYGPDGQPSADQSKAFRKNYAGIGYMYDAIRNAFIPQKPYNSWVLDEQTCLWKAPVDMPEDAGTGEPPKVYQWSEIHTNWQHIPPQPEDAGTGEPPKVYTWNETEGQWEEVVAEEVEE